MDVMTKAAPVAFETKVLGGKDGEPEGVVSAIVAVTCNRDQGGDIIMPGALKWGLESGITPKGVVAHDWSATAAKAIQVTEIMPGNTALPGELLGKGLGGMRVKMQFNLKTTRGADAFADVEFYGDDQEWSIGYAGFGTYLAGPDVDKTMWDQICKQLPDSTVDAVKSAGMARILPQVKTYEFSTVLFGMNTETVTEQVKSGDTHIHVADLDAIVAREVAKAIEKIHVLGTKHTVKCDAKVSVVRGVKLWLEDDSFPGTIEAFCDSVRDAVNAWVEANVQGDPANGDYMRPWVSVVATYPDSVVVTINGLVPDPDTHEADITLQFPMTVDADGTVTLGDPKEVELQVTIQPPSDQGDDMTADLGGGATTVADMRGQMGATAEGFDVHVLGLEESIGHLAGAVADDVKAGAVQARRNRERLTAALSAIQAMVDELPAESDARGDKGAQTAIGDVSDDPVAAMRAQIAAETADIDKLVGAATL